MKKIAKIVCGVLLGTLAVATSAAAGPTAMQISGETSQPVGHLRFCQKYGEECGRLDRPNQVVRLSNAAWEDLQAVNEAVNAAIVPATDMQLFGVAEIWDYPQLAGDCEDYVLEKRRALIKAGWPASALLITVVRDEVGDGHAVLTVRTDRGDLVLDNKRDDILIWSQTAYHYLKRQSTVDAGSWDAIADGRDAMVSSVGAR